MDNGRVFDLNNGSEVQGNIAAERKQRENIAKYGEFDPNLVLLKAKQRPCKHDSKNLMCNQVRDSDILLNRRHFYSAEGKEKQDIALTHFLSAYTPKRNRQRGTTDTPRPKTVSLKYYLKIENSGKVKAVPVCKKFIAFALGVAHSRLLRIGREIAEGRVPKEKRGGDRMAAKNSAKREKVKSFIGNLRCEESHYGRNKSKRVYLSSELSVRRLHKIYQDAAPHDRKEASLRLPNAVGNAKPTKYHYFPHNQHIYLLPECAIQQVCNAVYVRLNYTQPLCACPSRYREPCSASLNSDDLHTTELATSPNGKVLTLVKTCEPVADMRICRSPRDWSLLALQNIRTGKSHYLVICRCPPETSNLEGPMSHDQPTYASVPGIRVYGMMCVSKSYEQKGGYEKSASPAVSLSNNNRRARPMRTERSLFFDNVNPPFPWDKVKELATGVV